MQESGIVKSILAGLVLLVATSAMAANKGSLQVGNSISVNGTQLQPGNYKLQWEGNGPNVELSILKGKNVVVTTTAHVIELSSPAMGDAATVQTSGDGTRSLAEVRFGGKRFALAIGDAAPKAEMQSSAK
ncbi:MAG: hypothetical protein JOY93_06755 [Acidobacteriales bacterium]|nr:hypothetical protein [Terriglobales bacterium]